MIPGKVAAGRHAVGAQLRERGVVDLVGCRRELPEVDPRAAEPCAEHPDGTDLVGDYGVRICVELDEVRELADFDRADLVLTPQRERGVDRVSTKRLIEGCGFFGGMQGSPPCLPPPAAALATSRSDAPRPSS